jgi:hypothetical protein
MANATSAGPGGRTEHRTPDEGRALEEKVARLAARVDELERRIFEIESTATPPTLE